MDLKTVHQGIGRHRPRKRIGRGIGSGRGGTSTRGNKGQKSRAGSKPHGLFEGGQMKLARRIPKRGFHNRWALTYAVVNVKELDSTFQDGDTVDPAKLRELGLAKGRYDAIKILGDGELTKKLSVKAHKFSQSAQSKIAGAGGNFEIISGD